MFPEASGLQPVRTFKKDLGYFYVSVQIIIYTIKTRLSNWFLTNENFQVMTHGSEQRDDSTSSPKFNSIISIR